MSHMTQESAFPGFFCFLFFWLLFLFILQKLVDMLPVKHNIVIYGVENLKNGINSKTK